MSHDAPGDSDTFFGSEGAQIQRLYGPELV